MIITTTPSIEGRRIVDYRGIVFGEVVSGVDFVRDLAASFTNFFGGRSGGYEEELVTARQNALTRWLSGRHRQERMLLWELTLIMKFSGLTEIC